MPAVESRKFIVLLIRDVVFVEGSVMRMLQVHIFEPLVGTDEAVTNDLDLWLVWNGLQVWVKDASLGIECFAVAIVVRCRIEAFCELVLCFGR